MKADELVGKTITGAKIQKLTKYDAVGYFEVDFSDGSECIVIDSLGTYTGNSLEEYPT